MAQRSATRSTASTVEQAHAGDTDHPVPGVARTRLPGGLTVVTEHVAGSRSAAVGLWVGVGSRHERGPLDGPGQHGAAHFLEHLLFKGTTRRTAGEIAEEIDAVGGDLNAFTGKEQTCFHAHVLDSDLPLAVDVLCDVVLDARMDAADVELERDVVMSEIAGREDDPEDLLADDFDALVLDDHPLALPVIGSEESVTAMTRAVLAEFHAAHYVPGRAVLSAAGNVVHTEVVDAVVAGFGARLSGPVAARVAPDVAVPDAVLRLPDGCVSVREEDTEQAHVMLGGPGLRRRDPRWEAQMVLSTVLGGGMSSRLFQQVRERRGLAYSVYSSTSGWSDRGTFAVYVGCAPERLGRAAAVLCDELGEMAAHGITDVELARAQGQLRGELVLGLEDTSARMSRLGRRELAPGPPLDVAASLARVAEVTVADVADLAATLLGGPRALAVVGPYGDVDALPDELKAATEAR